MKKSFKMVLVSMLALLMAVSTIGMIIVSADEGVDGETYVNSWYAGDGWNNDAGNGYTYLTGNTNLATIGKYTIANKDGLDVTKAIVVDVWEGYAGAWSFIALSTSYDNAKAIATNTYENVPLEKTPFYHMYNGSASGASKIWGGQANLTGVWSSQDADAVVDGQIGFVDWVGFTQDYYNSVINACKTIEIYFGETVDKGYVKVEGVIVGKPAATQSAFTSGKAYLSLNSWNNPHWMVKVTQAEPSYNEGNVTPPAEEEPDLDDLNNVGDDVLVNGWHQNPAAQFVNDAGDGWAYIGTNNNGVANATAFDITKPIVLDVFTQMGGAFSFITLSTTYTYAKGVTNEIYDANNATYGAPANLDKWPFVHMFTSSKIWDETEGNIGAMWTTGTRFPNALLPYTGTDYSLKAFPYNCDFSQDFYDKCKALAHRIEIYVGETVEEGYVLIDGQFVARPSATQASYYGGTAYLNIESWSWGHWCVKASQLDEAKDMTGANRVFFLETYGEDVLYPIDADKVELSVTAPKHTAGVVANGESISFTVDVFEAFNLEAIQVCGFDGSVVNYTTDAEGITPDENGVYTVTATGDTAIVFKLQTDINKLILTADGANARLTSGEELVNPGDTVTFIATALSAIHEITKVSYVIDGVETELEVSATGRYTFTIPEDITGGSAVYVNVVGGEKAKQGPSESEIANSVNGWDSSVDGKYGALWSEGVQQMFDLGDGSTFITLDNSGSISATSALDVTKPIYFDIIQKYTEDPTVAAPWVFMTMYDRWGLGSLLGAEVYGGTNNDKYDIPARTASKFQLSWLGVEDVTQIAAGGSESVYGDVFYQDVISVLENKFGRENWVFAEGNTTDRFRTGEFTKIEIYFGETAADGYIKIDGMVIGKPAAVQSDFELGVAYLHMSYFYTSSLRVKLYQEASLNITEQVDENATIVLEDGYSLENLMAYDEVKFKINFTEGYTAKAVSANGKVLTSDENGVYTYRVAFGGASIKVESSRAITIKFNVNGGSAIDDVVIGNGGTILTPMSTKHGYTLAWYADETFTTEFDFSQPIVSEGTEVIVYAKWTPVTYYINYYDDVNKIRDLSINTYNIESSITLEAPVKEGYSFVGWYDNVQFTGDVVTTIEPGNTGDISLYAKFEKVEESAAEAGCFGGISVSSFGLIAMLFGAVVALKKKNA